LKKSVKILVIALGALVALLVVGAVVVSLVFDPNKYKDDIVQLVKKQTGRDLKIDGKISLAFFPWLGVDLPAVQLSNAPGFGQQPFAQVQHAGVYVKLLPLLRKQVVVRKISLDGLRLRLARNHAGGTNWDDLRGAKATPAAPAQEKPDGAAPAIGGLVVGGVAVRDAEVSWNDQVAGSAYTVKHLDLKTGELSPGKPADISIGFDLESGSPKINTRVTLDARLALDLEAQTLDLPSLSLTLAGMNLKLSSVKGNHIMDAPVVSGRLDIAPFDPRALMKQLGVSLETADPKALAKTAFATQFNASGKDVQLKDLKIVLDDSTVSGSFALRDFTNPGYRFDIAIDTIDIDRYMPPPPAKTGDSKAAPPAAPAPVVIPLDALRGLNVDGGIKIKQLVASGLHSRDVSTHIKAKDGLINIGPSQARLYDGSYHGATTIDARGKVLALAMEEKVSSVKVGDMLKDMRIFQNFSGTGDVSLKVTAQGLDAQQVKRTLNGNVAVALKDGALQGADFLKMYDAAVALKATLSGKEAPVKTDKTDRTAFETLSASARITNGVAQNDDLLLKTPGLQVTGHGAINLVTESFEKYHLSVIKTKDIGQKCKDYPFLWDGAFTSAPKLDLATLAACQGKEKIEKKKEELIQKGLEGLFKKKQK
jgi:AsmA protein